MVRKRGHNRGRRERGVTGYRDEYIKRSARFSGLKPKTNEHTTGVTNATVMVLEDVEESSLNIMTCT